MVPVGQRRIPVKVGWRRRATLDKRIRDDMCCRVGYSTAGRAGRRRKRTRLTEDVGYACAIGTWQEDLLSHGITPSSRSNPAHPPSVARAMIAVRVLPTAPLLRPLPGPRGMGYQKPRA